MMKSEGEGAQKLDRVHRPVVQLQSRAWGKQEQTHLLNGFRPRCPWLCTLLVLKF